jgi:hypothetical protein
MDYFHKIREFWKRILHISKRNINFDGQELKLFRPEVSINNLEAQRIRKIIIDKMGPAYESLKKYCDEKPHIFSDP